MPWAITFHPGWLQRPFALFDYLYRYETSYIAFIIAFQIIIYFYYIHSAAYLFEFISFVGLLTSKSVGSTCNISAILYNTGIGGWTVFVTYVLTVLKLFPTVRPATLALFL